MVRAHRLIAFGLLAAFTASCAAEDELAVSEQAEPNVELTAEPEERLTEWPCPPFDGVETDAAGVADPDGDGLYTCQEERLTTSSDEADSDGDGVDDLAEIGDVLVPVDTDNDDTIDALDTDDDGDSVDTADEDVDGDGDPMNDDTDEDTVPNYLDSDDDGDGVPSADEAGLDTNNDGLPDTIDDDDDGDACPTAEEGDGDPNGNGVPAYLDDTECVG
jgi:hypothetical protein